MSLFYKFPLFFYTDLLNAFMHFLLLILLFEININQLISLIGYSSKAIYDSLRVCDACIVSQLNSV